MLSEIGVINTPMLVGKSVSTLSELIQFYCQEKLEDPSLEEIKEWKDQLSLGVKPSVLAGLIAKKDTPSVEMDS